MDFFDRRTKIESGLTKQKEEISKIIKEYDGFIRKLISDKKNLNEKCQKYSNSYDKIVGEFNNFKEINEKRLIMEFAAENVQEDDGLFIEKLCEFYCKF